MARRGARALLAGVALLAYAGAQALPCGGAAGLEPAHAAHGDAMQGRALHSAAPASVAAICPCGCESGPAAGVSGIRVGFALAAAVPASLAAAAPARRAAPRAHALPGHPRSPDHVPLPA